MVANTVTKAYYYFLHFMVGNARSQDPSGIQEESIRHAISKSQLIPSHRIEILAHEDSCDPADHGAASLRLASIRDRFTAESIPEDRVMSRLHQRECRLCTELSGKSVRLVEIFLWPAIDNLSPEKPGPRYLDYDEYSALCSMRTALLFTRQSLRPNPSPIDGEERMAYLLDHFASIGIDWQRVVGHASVADWARAGGFHWLWDDEARGAQVR